MSCLYWVSNKTLFGDRIFERMHANSAKVMDFLRRKTSVLKVVCCAVHDINRLELDFTQLANLPFFWLVRLVGHCFSASAIKANVASMQKVMYQCRLENNGEIQKNVRLWKLLEREVTALVVVKIWEKEPSTFDICPRCWLHSCKTCTQPDDLRWYARMRPVPIVEGIFSPYEPLTHSLTLCHSL